MMLSVTLPHKSLPANTPEQDEKLYAFQNFMLDLPQKDITTHHILHAGTYTRTIFIPADTVLMGAKISVPTTLTIIGHAQVTVGDSVHEVKGFKQIAASAGRKQMFHAITDVILSSTYATKCDTVENAEKEFTVEAESLMSRQPFAINESIITGEKP